MNSHNWKEDMASQVEQLNPVRWKVGAMEIVAGFCPWSLLIINHGIGGYIWLPREVALLENDGAVFGLWPLRFLSWMNVFCGDSLFANLSLQFKMLSSNDVLGFSVPL